MKIVGDYVLREVAGDTILVPVGSTALQFNGILALEPVGALIWKGIIAGKNKEELLSDILEQFEIDSETAANDLNEFLLQLQTENLLIVD